MASNIEINEDPTKFKQWLSPVNQMVKLRESINAYAWVLSTHQIALLVLFDRVVVQHMLPYITQHDSISSTL
jgi:hypothetical protein